MTCSLMTKLILVDGGAHVLGTERMVTFYQFPGRISLGLGVLVCESKYCATLKSTESPTSCKGSIKRSSNLPCRFPKLFHFIAPSDCFVYC